MPFALTREGAHGPVIHAANTLAEEAGVSVGARAVDMQALCRTLQLAPADVAGDGRALLALAHWSRRWCPWVAVDGNTVDGGAGLVMDVSGAAHLWGGEVAMLAEMQARYAALGFTARIAIAPTWGAAWAMVRYGRGAVITAQNLRQAIAPLPVAALRLDAATGLVLQRLGLKTIGHLTGIPRAALTRRFRQARADGSTPMRRLDQALGVLPEPITPLAEPVRFAVHARLPEPIFDPTEHLPDLTARLGADLQAEGQGARRLCLRIYRTDGTMAEVLAAASTPSQDGAHLAWLLGGKLEGLNPGYGFDAMTLEAPLCEPIAARQRGLDGKTPPDEELAPLIDRLTARLGAKAVEVAVPQASHIPERAEIWVAAINNMAQTAALSADHLPPRPARLFDPPEEVTVLYAVPEGPPARFQWRRQVLRVTRYDGPERISPEWWQDRPGTRFRDYYRIEVEGGARYWLYREGLLGDGRGDAPRWFMHGVFG